MQWMVRALLCNIDNELGAFHGGAVIRVGQAAAATGVAVRVAAGQPGFVGGLGVVLQGIEQLPRQYEATQVVSTLQ